MESGWVKLLLDLTTFSIHNSRCSCTQTKCVESGLVIRIKITLATNKKRYLRHFTSNCQEKKTDWILLKSKNCMLALDAGPLCCVILTDFGCHHIDLVLYSCLSVQVVVSGNSSLNGVNVKTAVRLCVPFQWVPAEMRAGHMRGEQVKVVSWVRRCQRSRRQALM